VDALGNTPMPFVSVESCWLSFFPGESQLLQVFLDYASPVCSWLAWSSRTQEIPSITLDVVDTGDPSVVHIQANEVFVLWDYCQCFVAQFYLVSLWLARLSKRRLICFFVICDEHRPVFSLTLLSEATALHCIKGSKELLISTVLSWWEAWQPSSKVTRS